MKKQTEKVLRFFEKQGPMLLLLLTAVILAAFFLVRGELIADASVRQVANGEIDGVLPADTEGTWPLQVPPEAEGCELECLMVQLAEENPEAIGEVNIQLLQDGREVAAWTVSEGEYHFLTTGRKLILPGDGSLSLTVSSRGLAESNGLRAVGTQPWVRLDYNNNRQLVPVMWIGAGLFLLALVLVLLKAPQGVTMGVLLALCGLCYLLLCPPGMAPDEQGHFYRAFEVSCGQPVSQHMGYNGVGGNTFPAALKDFEDPAAVLDWNELADYEFGNLSLYSPVNYLPQAAGMGLTRLFTNNVRAIFYGGKAGNFLFALALCLLTLWAAPFGRTIFFLVMMLPINLQEMVSVSADAPTTALALLFTALVLRLRYRQGNVPRREWILLAVTAVMLSLCKIVYVALLLLLFLLPLGAKERSEGKRLLWVALGLLGLCAVLNLIWLKISAGYLVEFAPGVDTPAQVSYVLHHPIEFVKTMIRTVGMELDTYVPTMIGSMMGAWCIPVTGFAWLVMALTLVYECCQNRDCRIEVLPGERFLPLVTFLATAGLILTSLYVQWTGVMHVYILGVQGRYFIPILPLLGLFLVLTRRQRQLTAGYEQPDSPAFQYGYFIVLLVNGVTVLDMLLYYFLHG